jgi:7,8-dihydropterin-6-yl-methyl-4-(beta-D-ribofuranosyl)aminobenzene 5'-phosphate synthase
LLHDCIHILIDDRPSPAGDNTRELIPEHGFSLYFEQLGKKWLLVTELPLILKNANTLGIDFSEADHLVLSHVHYDHTGGLKSFLKLTAGQPFTCHVQ